MLRSDQLSKLPKGKPSLCLRHPGYIRILGAVANGINRKSREQISSAVDMCHDEPAVSVIRIMCNNSTIGIHVECSGIGCSQPVGHLGQRPSWKEK